jgi:hypothetical protein
LSAPDTPPTQDPQTAFSKRKWRRLGWRLLFTLLMGLAFYLGTLVLVALAVVQLIVSITHDEPNKRLRHFGQALGRYLRQIVDYMSFAREDVPFPFSEWPDSD